MPTTYHPAYQHRADRKKSEEPTEDADLAAEEDTTVVEGETYVCQPVRETLCMVVGN